MLLRQSQVSSHCPLIFTEAITLLQSQDHYTLNNGTFGVLENYLAFRIGIKSDIGSGMVCYFA